MQLSDELGAKFSKFQALPSVKEAEDTDARARFVALGEWAQWRGRAIVSIERRIALEINADMITPK
jgi:hypothetical protein